ncbi:MAG: hypothetical protein WBG32_10700 [Nodosilinea sp.]
MPQPHGYSLQSAAQPLSIDTILRPVSLGDGGSFNGYFTGAELPEVVGMTGFSPSSEALSPVLAQQFDQDILGDIVSIWNGFVESGQLWALLFGIVLGYFIRNLTAF